VKFPKQVPVMTLSNATLLPGAMLPLYIFEPRYRQMLADVLEGDRMFSVALRDPEAASERPLKLAGIGLVRASMQNPDGTSHLILQGLARIRFTETVSRRPYRIEKMEIISDSVKTSPEADLLAGQVRDLLRAATKTEPPPEDASAEETDEAEESQAAAREFVKQLSDINDPGTLADIVAGTCLRRPAQRQEILEALEPELRLRKLIAFLTESAR
jgi:Lon protease-like protein